MHFRTLLFPFAICLSLSLGCCASSPRQAPDGLPLSAVGISESSPRAEIHAEYPSFPGHPLPDERISSILGAEIADFRSSSAENWKSWEECASSEEKAEPRPPHELILRWKVGSLSPARVSILLEAYSYTGGAHGDTRLYSINYDPVRKRFIELGDVLENKAGNWLEVLAAAARAGLASQLGREPADDPVFAEGSAPRPGNYACFTFDESSFTIYFQRYQVGPGSSGNPSVTLPRDMAAPDYLRR